jgi:hypothetical protein
MKPDIKQTASHIRKRAHYRRLELLQYLAHGWSREQAARHHSMTVTELDEALKESKE